MWQGHRKAVGISSVTRQKKTIKVLLALPIDDFMATTPFCYALSDAKEHSSVIFHQMTVCAPLFLLQYQLSIKMLKLIRHLISKWKVIILSQNFIPITFFLILWNELEVAQNMEIKQSIRSSLNIIEIGAIKSISHGWHYLKAIFWMAQEIDMLPIKKSPCP